MVRLNGACPGAPKKTAMASISDFGIEILVAQAA